MKIYNQMQPLYGLQLYYHDIYLSSLWLLTYKELCINRTVKLGASVSVGPAVHPGLCFCLVSCFYFYYIKPMHSDIIKI